MKINKKYMITCCLVLAVLVLAGCGGRTNAPGTETPAPEPTAEPAATPTPVPTPSPTTEIAIATPTPEAVPDPEPSATPEPEPSPETEPSPTPTATPEPVPTLPKVTKSPTDETVDEGGSCWFIAKYENAQIAVWHFVSPDGQTDMTYEAAQTAFPTMEILNGMYSNLQLKNIPYSANGWKVYCRYSNPGAGYVDTGKATITVRQGQSQVVTATGFEGNWVEEYAGRCQLTIISNGNGLYSAGIAWSSSAWERSCWTMTARASGQDYLEYHDGEYWVEFYESDGSQTVSNQRSGESGYFYKNDQGKLVWHDNVMGETVMVPSN